MYKQALDLLIKNKKIPKSLMLYGESEYFRNLYLEKIATILGSKEEQLRFYFDEYDYRSAKNFVSQSSLFGDKNILIIKTEKNIPKKELESLIKSCQKNKNSYFILEYHEPLNKTRNKAKDISRIFTKKLSADFVRFFKPYFNEAILHLQNYAEELKLSIDTYSLEHLYNLQNENLSLCMKEIEKLTVLDKNITTNDIENFSYGLGIENIDKILEDFILKKDIKIILKDFLKNNGSNEVLFINAIEQFINQLFLFHIYIKTYGRCDVKEILGYPLPSVIATKRANLAIKINLSTFEKLFYELLNIDFTLKKSTYIDKETYFITSLIKLQSYL